MISPKLRSKGNGKDSYEKGPDLDTKIGKYFINRKVKKMTKKDAALAANYYPSNTYSIERTKTFKALEQKYYKDELLKKISVSEIAEEQKKVILQDRDLGAKNVAIKQALQKIEPDDTPGSEDDKVIIVLK